jgi:hypothetical protein
MDTTIAARTDKRAPKPTTTPMPLPNNAFIARGIDLVRYDPNDPAGTGNGPSEDIFVLDVSSTEPNGWYLIPKGTQYTSDPSSEFESVSYTIKSAAGFSESFVAGASATVSIKGGPFGLGKSLFSASFSASASYQKHQQGAQESAGVAAESHALVTCWVLTNEWTSPQGMPLTDAFRKAVAGLPATYDRAAYLAFIRRFGTHFAADITFGGRAWQSFLMKSSQYQSLESQGTNVSVGASVGFGTSVSSGTVYSEKDQEQWQQLSQSSESTTVKYFGGSDLSTWDTWAATVPNDPLPVSMDLKDVADLLSPANFKDDPNIGKKHDAMLQAIPDYVLETCKGLVLTRNAPTGSDQTNMLRFVQIAPQMFWVMDSSSGLFWFSTAAPPQSSGLLPTEYWLQPVSGAAGGPVRTGDVVYLGERFSGANRYLCALGTTVSWLDAPDASCQWKVLLAQAPSSMGELVVQGTPLLLQNVQTGMLMVEVGKHLEASANLADASKASKMAFV